MTLQSHVFVGSLPHLTVPEFLYQNELESLHHLKVPPF